MNDRIFNKQKAIELAEIGKQKLLETRGGCLLEQEAAELLNVDSNSISHKRENHEIIGVNVNGEFKYPLWQFNDNRIIHGLDQILMVFSKEQLGTWTQLNFFVGTNKYLESKLTKYPNPIDALKAGELNFVKTAAEKFVGIGI